MSTDAPLVFSDEQVVRGENDYLVELGVQIFEDEYVVRTYLTEGTQTLPNLG